MPPHLYLTAETDDFDEVIMQHWREEGFDVAYLPFNGDGHAYTAALQNLADDLEAGESYGLIAYGAPSSICLDIHTEPQPHLAVLVCYYPPSIADPRARYPPHLQLVVHLAGSQGFNPAFASYTYPGTEPGFAEHDLEAFDKVAAGLAWSRTLGAVRKGFGVEVDLERIWEGHVQEEFMTRDAAATMATMVAEPYVNHIPTLTGGIGKQELYRFYRDFFIPSNPPTLNIRLVSRTIGVDRVVDEMLISFRHTQEIPWMLPGVPPTDKQVQVALVSVVCIRGGKLYHEHIYWDQASVLVQIGALDPQLVPESLRKRGMERLPVVGEESAIKMIDEDSVPSNELIPNW
ncbi:hypothetical protein H2199_000982 [Coniosporium tulheliwenetii]|uniref:Uncharacterized protein n=1 Tax=Coniosporium tulheliwenetii TaxID=3383036 RepID=A0ACC2ZNB8_9PEZI|nr:hypothetical protein H2199_000982 [Cladosporium sp. JES 115]